MGQRLQRRAALREVDRAAIVRVDQAVLPQLAALIEVGDAGGGQRQQFLAQRIALGVRVEFGDQRGQLTGQWAIEHGVQPPVYRVLEVGVRILPGGASRGLADRLLGVPVQPVAQRSGDCAIHRPHPEDVLPQEQSGCRVGAGGDGLGVGDELRPARRHLGQHPAPGPHILAAFGVVGGQRGHRLRPQPRPGGGTLMKLRRPHPEPLRVTPDLVEGHQPGVAVEQAVLARLGGHRTAQLL
ncbi:hypothetical protein C1Y40_02286 [Mycobacterium talmoniae]|uniref:Uncharacterized protein n=1 Tax=Mycobacterium talmoniae TaxID=1858794 RepID=A0A2S8BLD3_9MYCO|nr:hypothetical protein C1Y40_02286 [Mycobacterium talmoniae]